MIIEKITTISDNSEWNIKLEGTSLTIFNYASQKVITIQSTNPRKTLVLLQGAIKELVEHLQ